MLKRLLGQGMRGAAWWRPPLWYTLRIPCQIGMAVCYRLKVQGREHVPVEGPVMIVSNHQSFFDPVILGVGAHVRPYWSMARESLFEHRFMGRLIAGLNAIPVARGAGDRQAVRRCTEVLEAGHALVVYPEGTRTADGHVGPLMRGFTLMLRKVKPPVVPAAIAGAHDVWPRSRKKPRWTGRIGVRFGEPIASETLLAMGDAAGDQLRARIEAMRGELRQDLGLSPLPPAADDLEAEHDARD